MKRQYHNDINRTCNSATRSVAAQEARQSLLTLLRGEARRCYSPVVHGLPAVVALRQSNDYCVVGGARSRGATALAQRPKETQTTLSHCPHDVLSQECRAVARDHRPSRRRPTRDGTPIPNHSALSRVAFSSPRPPPLRK